MTAFQQAMANQNHQLGKTLERMGMSMAEFVEHMKEKDKKPMEDPVVVGSSGPPPPPPPAPPIIRDNLDLEARAHKNLL
jgi:hypothetical protein